MKIINLTQHKASKEQIVAGVIDTVSIEKRTKLLTFTELPDIQELVCRAGALVSAAMAAERTENLSGIQCMIGGAPYLMSILERKIKEVGGSPVYSFSKRESIEIEKEGKVTKTTVFKHLGFVYPCILIGWCNYE